MSGLKSYYSGLAAENIVARDYVRRGYTVQKTRWKTANGEIDLILRKDRETVFVEVKKSRDFAAAAAALGTRQIARLFNAAAQFLGTLPTGLDSPARFDLALVNGRGQIDILENALSA